jgi:hypothetical protein
MRRFELEAAEKEAFIPFSRKRREGKGISGKMMLGKGISKLSTCYWRQQYDIHEVDHGVEDEELATRESSFNPGPAREYDITSRIRPENPIKEPRYSIFKSNFSLSIHPTQSINHHNL